MNEAVLSRLMCPRSKKSLRLLNEQEWTEIKTRLNQEEVETAFGAIIHPQGGAICMGDAPSEAKWFYPLAEGLLYLMPNDAVDL